MKIQILISLGSILIVFSPFCDAMLMELGQNLGSGIKTTLKSGLKNALSLGSALGTGIKNAMGLGHDEETDDKAEADDADGFTKEEKFQHGNDEGNKIKMENDMEIENGYGIEKNKIHGVGINNGMGVQSGMVNNYITRMGLNTAEQHKKLITNFLEMGNQERPIGVAVRGNGRMEMGNNRAISPVGMEHNMGMRFK